MVTQKEIDDAEIPFDDEITDRYKRRKQQQDWRTDEQKAAHYRKLLKSMPLSDMQWVRQQLDIVMSEKEVQQEIKEYLPVHPTPSPSRNIPHTDEIVFEDIHAVDRFLEELGDLVRREVEDEKYTLQAIAPPSLQHIPQVPHYSKQKVGRKKIKRYKS